MAATGALGAACWRKDARWIAFFLFLSTVIYFFPSVVTLFDGSTLDDILLMRTSGAQDSIKLVAVLAVLVCTGLLIRLAPLTDLLRPIPLLLAIALFAGMLTQSAPLQTSQLINTLSLIGMLCVLTASANALVRGAHAWTAGPDTMGRFFVCLLLLTGLAVGVGFYEIAFERAWASFYSSDEKIVMRASSLFFNPNLFGLFCILLSIFFAFHWHTTPRNTRPHPALTPGIFLAGLGMYLASSRSMGYLLLLFFISTCILLPRGTRGRFIPLVLYLASLSLAAAVSAVWWRMDNQGPAEHFWVLSLRLFDSPLQILAMCLQVLQIQLPFDLAELALKPETVVAVEGRFMGEERDSGLFTAYDDSGWGVAAMFFFWASALAVGLYAYAKQRSITATYALVTTGVCLAVGVFMRYQVYPVWIWLALMLAPCFAFWRNQLRATFVRTWL